MRSEDEEDEDDFEEEVDEDEDALDARANGYAGDEPMEYDEEDGSGDDDAEDDAEGENDEDEDDEDEDDDAEADPDAEDDNDNEDEDEDDEDEERNSDDEADGEDVDMNADEASSHTSRDSPKNKSPRALPAPPHLVRRNLFVPAYSSPPTSLSIEAIVAIPLPCPVYSLASTTCCSYLLTGGADGHIRAYDFWASVNGGQLMTAQQRTFVGLGEGLTKGGVPRGWWTNEVDGIQGGVVSKRVEGVYSLAVEGDGLWALSGTQSGPINLHTLRHSPGQLVHSLKGHTSVVSAMTLLPSEKGFLSGSWDGTVREWDLNTGQTVRQYPTHGAQISSLSLRPYAPITPTPSPDTLRGDEDEGEEARLNGIGAAVSINIAPSSESDLRTGTDAPGEGILATSNPGEGDTDGATTANQTGESDESKPSGGDVEMAGSDAASPFDPLFDEDAEGETVPPSGAGTSAQTPVTNINDMAPPAMTPPKPKPVSSGLALPGMPKSVKTEPPTALPSAAPSTSQSGNSTPLFNLPQPVASSSKTAASGIPLLSKTTYKAFSDDVMLTSSMDGQVVLIDRRVPDYESGKSGVGRLLPGDKAPPWCMSACWSGNGTQVLAGRRNGTIDIWDVRRTSSSTAPNLLRTLRTPNESGSVSCIVALPDGRHIATASQDNIRLWNTEEYFTPEENMGRKKSSRPPFKIIAGHHGGTLSSMLVDPTSRFLITASGDRGWQGEATKVVLIHEIKW